MLAVLDDLKPIIDRFVTRYFGLRLMRTGGFEERLSNALEQYAELEERYREFLGKDEAKSVIQLFDSKFFFPPPFMPSRPLRK